MPINFRGYIWNLLYLLGKQSEQETVDQFSLDMACMIRDGDVTEEDLD